MIDLARQLFRFLSQFQSRTIVSEAERLRGAAGNEGEVVRPAARVCTDNKAIIQLVQQYCFYFWANYTAHQRSKNMCGYLPHANLSAWPYGFAEI